MGFDGVRRSQSGLLRIAMPLVFAPGTVVLDSCPDYIAEGSKRWGGIDCHAEEVDRHNFGDFYFDRCTYTDSMRLPSSSKAFRYVK